MGGRYRAILLSAHLAVVEDPVARIMKVLAPSVFEQNGAASPPGQDGREDEEWLLPRVATAKGAPDVRVDYADLVQWQVQTLGDMHPRLIGLIVAGVAGQFVAFPVHQATPSAQAGVIRVVV